MAAAEQLRKRRRVEAVLARAHPVAHTIPLLSTSPSKTAKPCPFRYLACLFSFHFNPMHIWAGGRVQRLCIAERDISQE
jgi:hypothetical protein